MGVLHWHEVGVEQPRRVKHELDDVRGASTSTSGHTELIERATNVPTILSLSTCDFWLVTLWFTVGSFTGCLVCWVVSDRQSKSQVLRSLIVAGTRSSSEAEAWDATVRREKTAERVVLSKSESLVKERWSDSECRGRRRHDGRVATLRNEKAESHSPGVGTSPRSNTARAGSLKGQAAPKSARQLKARARRPGGTSECQAADSYREVTCQPARWKRSSQRERAKRAMRARRRQIVVPRGSLPIGKVEAVLAKGACQKGNACEKMTDSRAVTFEGTIKCDIVSERI